MNEIVFCKNCEKRYTQNCGLYHGTINGKEYYVENGDNFGCIYGKEKNDIIMTNYDHIKSMSVEEIAEWIVGLKLVFECHALGGDAHEVVPKLNTSEKQELDDWAKEEKTTYKKWLLQEVIENE